MTSRLLQSVALLSLVGGLAAGCSTKPQAQKVKPSVGPEPGHVSAPMNDADEAEAVFRAAEADMQASLTVTEDPPPAPASQPEDSHAGAPVPAEPLRANRSVDRCTRACRALGSMQRAANRLCELTGEDDSRCERVRERVDEARTTVRASCPRCAAVKP